MNMFGTEPSTKDTIMYLVNKNYLLHARDTLQTSLQLLLLKSQNLFVDEKTLVLKGS